MTDVRGRDFYQYRQPFPLPDEATVGGRTFRGARARVYWLLRFTRERSHCHPVGVAHGPPGKVPRFLLVEPWSGGSSGDRRARELREYGCDIEIESYQGPQGETDTTLYTLTGEVPPPAATQHHRHAMQGGPSREELSRAGTSLGVARGTESSRDRRPSPGGGHPRDGMKSPSHGEEGAGRAAPSSDPSVLEACRRACEGRLFHGAVVDVDDAADLSARAGVSRVAWIYPQERGVEPSLCPQGCSGPEAYRRQLLGLYRRRRLHGLLEEASGALLAVSPTHVRRLGWDPLDVLAHAIERFGGQLVRVEVPSCVAS